MTPTCAPPAVPLGRSFSVPGSQFPQRGKSYGDQIYNLPRSINTISTKLPNSMSYKYEHAQNEPSTQTSSSVQYMS
ncbi:hypothetical protein L798_05547 [Zootermopsis nevadensis]|uniref:Uncharacterized protein n=1 Tax=Zootermopsis nevadensis TaxID=136037 RepID=A0A067RBK5_ZOONE|nr:hypothetical protein L798_05547 [Zootermopsis nevadensis]